MPVRAERLAQEIVHSGVERRWQFVLAIRRAEPLVFTPPFPSYPSAPGGVGAAARRVLERAFGADGHSTTLASPLLPDVVLHYTSWRQITHDIDDARIFGGIHYRFDQEEAARQGRKVGRYILRHLLRPVHRHGHDRAATAPVREPSTESQEDEE